MASAPTTSDTDLYNAEEFLALVPDGQKADLLDGVIYIASPDTRRNDALTGFIHSLLQVYAEVRGAGHVHGSRYAFFLGERCAPEPDVAFVSSEREHILQERGGEGPPDVAVEVVSRDSRARDYGAKKSLYEEAGVREYWILDPRQGRVEFHRLEAGAYRLVPLEHNRFFRSTALPGFWLDVEWLLATPRPSVYDCLQKVLAGEPA